MRWLRTILVLALVAVVAVLEVRTLLHHRMSRDAPDEISADAGSGGSPLRRRIDSIRFNGLPFADALKELSAKSGARIEPHWTVLETSGINGDAACTAHMENTTLGVALETILVDVGGGTVSLALKDEDGVIHVSTREELPGGGLICRVYDVADILDAIGTDLEAQRRELASAGPFFPTRWPKPDVHLAWLAARWIRADGWPLSGATSQGVVCAGDKLFVLAADVDHMRVTAGLRALRTHRPIRLRLFIEG